MELDDETRLIHEPARLRLMALLYASGETGAAAARRSLGFTAGNLDRHARRLEEAGLLQARRVLTPSGFEARYRIRPQGIRAFERYLQGLESFLADSLRARR